MKHKGAIFDLDGTILDSMPVWEGIGAELLKRQGITPPPDLERVLKASSFEQTARYFIERLGVKLSQEEILAQIHAMVVEQYEKYIGLKPYVRAFLEKLRQKGIRMCVATSNDARLAKMALTRLDVLSFFEFIVTCAEVGRGKDEPWIYFAAGEKLGVLPNEAVVFEDAPHCVKTAKKAGFFVAGVKDDAYGAYQEQIRETCDIYIESFAETECLF